MLFFQKIYFCTLFGKSRLMEIQIENLSKSYGPQKAVDAISFEVRPGEVVGFLGPNGAGKSTTMKMITGFLSIGEGEVKLGGKSVRDFGDELKRHIGYLPENNPLYLDMPVIDYLTFCGALQGMSKVDISRRLREMIHVCGLNAEKHKKIGELSKGYRQRVGLAQAMIHDPAVLVLDEPTTGLDPNQIVEIRNLIRELGKAKTVVLSTHILPEVEATCDRILIINNGKIVANGTAETLRKQAAGQEVVRLRIEDAPVAEILDALRRMPNIDTVDIIDKELNRLEVQSRTGTSSKREIFNLCVQKGWVLSELTPLETRLEDIFRNLTTN